MKWLLLAAAFISFSTAVTHAQIDGIRTATGQPFSMDARMVYGKIAIDGAQPGKKLPNIYVVLFDRRMQMHRTTLDKEGYFYFRDLPADGGTLIVEMNGTEVARQTLMTVGPKQQRVDFNVALAAGPETTAPPGTISVKYHYDRSKENTALMSKATGAIEDKKPDKAIPFLKKLLENDPADYAAWTILGASYLAANDQAAAEAAFVRALAARPDSVPSMTSLGRLYMMQKRYGPAIEFLEKASLTEPDSAVAFRLLGEAYLYDKKGTKGIAALNEALRLQPVEMAECHLLLARLYDIVGAKHLAAAEFKSFLEKVPDHPDRDKMKTYIKDTPVK